MKVAVLGASAKKGRYSNKALHLLAEKGHEVFPVHPALEKIDGIPVCSSLSEIDSDIDTVTMYVNSKVSDKLSEEILELKPKRIIFNPGTENSKLEKICEDSGIETISACTLVMLKTGQF